MKRKNKKFNIIKTVIIAFIVLLAADVICDRMGLAKGENVIITVEQGEGLASVA